MAAQRRSRPDTTLLLSLSVDGRITSHDSDDFDPDKGWKNLPGIRAILQQFYEFSEPGLSIMTTGIYMTSLGVNTREGTVKKEAVNLVVFDPDADHTPQGVSHIYQNVTRLYLVCLDSHPALTPTPGVDVNQLNFIPYKNEIDLNQLFNKLYRSYHLKRLIIHSIAPLNADLLDAGLIDHLSVIVSPLLVGGKGTPALQDADIMAIRPLTLVGTQVFSQNFVNLQYDVLNR
jgi:riboflavin biosynthesis pyrimidine reductase